MRGGDGNRTAPARRAGHMADGTLNDQRSHREGSRSFLGCELQGSGWQGNAQFVLRAFEDDIEKLPRGSADQFLPGSWSAAAIWGNRRAELQVLVAAEVDILGK